MLEKIFRLRVRHFLTFGPLLLLTMAVLWFSFFRLDWVRQIDIPEGYDFTSEVASIIEPTSDEMDLLDELNAKISALETELYEDDRMANYPGFGERDYSYKSANMFQRLLFFKDNADDLNACLAQHIATFGEIDRLIYQCADLDFRAEEIINSEYYSVLGYRHILSICFLYHIHRGEYAEAQARMGSLHSLLKIEMKKYDGLGTNIDSQFEEMLLLEIIAGQLTDFVELERSVSAAIIEEYEDQRPSFYEAAQRWLIATVESHRWLTEMVAQNDNSLARMLSEIYVSESQAENNLQMLYYLLVHEETEAEGFAAIERAGQVTRAGWRMIFYKELGSLSIVYDYGESFVGKYRYKNEVHKQRWLWRASGVYAAIWRYKVAHAALPTDLTELDLPAAETENIYYQKVSELEFYVKSIESLDASDPAQLETLMYEHAYWYYKEPVK